MHPLAILVVWKFLYFGRHECENFFWKKIENFSSPLFLTTQSWNAQIGSMGHIGLLGIDLGRD